jgi:hypothetical protein
MIDDEDQNIDLCNCFGYRNLILVTTEDAFQVTTMKYHVQHTSPSMLSPVMISPQRLAIKNFIHKQQKETAIHNFFRNCSLFTDE